MPPHPYETVNRDALVAVGERRVEEPAIVAAQGGCGREHGGFKSEEHRRFAAQCGQCVAAPSLHLPRRLMEPGLIVGIVVATEVEERGALSHAREPPPLVRAIYNNVPQPPLRVNAARGARRLLEHQRARHYTHRKRGQGGEGEEHDWKGV